MTRPMIVASALTAFAVGAFAGTDDYRFARARLVEPSAAVQRASQSDTEALVANAPFLPGDRVWTDGDGRAELQLFDGTLLWIDTRSKLDFSAGDQSGTGEPVVLQLWSGAISVDRRPGKAAQLDVETSAATVHVEPGAVVRVDATPGATRVSVHQGTTEVDSDDGDVSVQAGESTEVRPGRSPRAPWRTSDTDDFDAWVDERAAADTAVDDRHLPEELAAYAGELDQNGSWYDEPDIGYVWQPRVDADWSPYSSGRWTWTVIGWTWVPAESWGWAPSHYGRWGHSARLGWYWVPGRVFGPAWVSWAVGSNHIGWCALDRWNHPTRHETFRDGPYARGVHDGWTFVRRNDFAAHDLRSRRAVGVALDSAQFRVFESNKKRPDHRLDVALDAHRPFPVVVQHSSTWLRRPESRRERSRTLAVQAPDASTPARKRARSEAIAPWLDQRPDTRAHERSDNERSRTTTQVGGLPRWLSPAQSHQEGRRVQSPASQQEQRGAHRHTLMERVFGRASSAQREAAPQAQQPSPQAHERPSSSRASSDSSHSSRDQARERHPSRRGR
jgi:hypothetical protein